MPSSIPYPDDFACASRIEGHSAAIFAGLVRTAMQHGNTRQRRAHRSIPHQISLAFVMPQTAYAEWLTWCNDHAWLEWVEMNLPGLEAGVAGTDTAPILIRFCSDLRVELLPVHRLWYWRATVECEWQPAQPPEGGELVVGLHLNGDLSDATPRLIAYDTPDYTAGGVAQGTFVAAAGAYGQQAYRMQGLNNPVRTLDLPVGECNLGPEWQLSAWIKPETNSSYGHIGGAFLQMLSRGHNGGSTIGGSVPLTPYSGQLEIRFLGTSTCTVQVRYPSFNSATGNVESVSLKTPAGALPPITKDVLHHVGIAADLTSVRLYVDGVQIADDADISVARPAGQRPMYDGIAFADQCCFIGGLFGGGSGGYTLAEPWGTPFPSFSAFWAGNLSEIEIRRGPGSVTYIGPTCTVPTGPFT